MIEEGYELYQSPLPILILVTKEINIPRLPSLRRTGGRSKSAKIPTLDGPSDLGLRSGKVGLAGIHTPGW